MTDTTPGAEPALPGARPRRPTPLVMGLHPADFFVPATAVGAVVASGGAYYTVTVEGAVPAATAFSAWHGLLGWAGVVLMVAAGAVVAAGLVGIVALVPARSAALCVCLAAAACTLASYVVTPGDLCADLVYLDGDCAGAVVGRGPGFTRTLIATGGGAFVALYWHLVDRRRRA